MTVVRMYAWLALSGLIVASIWASSQVSIVPAIEELLARPAAGFNPWFWATLADAYFGFLWFWLWVAYKETAWWLRGLWLLLILSLGNMAMAAYVLLQLRRLPPDARIEHLLLRRT
jgi:hypothetical protein